MSSRHALDRFPRAEECANDVRPQNPVDTIGIHCLDACLPCYDSSVVDQDAQRAEPFVNGAKQLLHILLIRYIGSDCYGLRGQSLDFAQHCVRGSFIRTIVDANRVTLLGQQARGSGAYSAAASRNDCSGHWR